MKLAYIFKQPRPEPCHPYFSLCLLAFAMTLFLFRSLPIKNTSPPFFFSILRYLTSTFCSCPLIVWTKAKDAINQSDLISYLNHDIAAAHRILIVNSESRLLVSQKEMYLVFIWRNSVHRLKFFLSAESDFLGCFPFSFVPSPFPFLLSFFFSLFCTALVHRLYRCYRRPMKGFPQRGGTS